MMIFYQIFFIFTFLYLPQSNIYETSVQIDESSSFSPFYFVSIEASCIDTTYKIGARTKSIPPRSILIIDKFVYQLTFTMIIESDSAWNKIFYLNILFKDRSLKLCPFNEELIELTPDIIYKFSTIIESNKNEKITLSLSSNPVRRYQDLETDNPFKTKEIVLK